MKTSDSSPEKKSVLIEPQNKKGLVQILGVTLYILNRMLEDSKDEIGEPTGTTYSQKQVQYMINKYGIMER